MHVLDGDVFFPLVHVCRAAAIFRNKKLLWGTPTIEQSASLYLPFLPTHTLTHTPYNVMLLMEILLCYRHAMRLKCVLIRSIGNQNPVESSFSSWKIEEDTTAGSTVAL